MTVAVYRCSAARAVCWREDNKEGGTWQNKPKIELSGEMLTEAEHVLPVFFSGRRLCDSLAEVFKAGLSV